jgi:hypothetical protein
MFMVPFASVSPSQSNGSFLLWLRGRIDKKGSSRLASGVPYIQCIPTTPPKGRHQPSLTRATVVELMWAY